MKKLISMLLVLCMVLGMSVSAFADETANATVSTLDELKNALNNENITSITLSDNITIGNNAASCIKIESGKNITLDLNGYTISQSIVDGGLSVAAVAIRQGATLTVKDSSENQTGKISATATAVQLTGTLNLYSGTIACDVEPTNADKEADFAYPVWIYIPANSNATPVFNMEGGSLTLGSTQEKLTYADAISVDDTFGTLAASENITINIEAGNVEGELAGVENTNISISGGTFTTDVTNYLESNLEQDNSGTVVPTTPTTGEGNTVPVVPDTSVEDDSLYYEEEDESYSVVVRVKFDGVDEELFDEIKVNLLRNGKKYESEELSASKISKKNWRVEFEDLDEDEEWSVALAEELEGYNAEVVNLRGNYWTITLSEVEKAPVVSTDKSNPDTGASDFVGVAMALAVVSSMGAVALSKRK